MSGQTLARALGDAEATQTARRPSRASTPSAHTIHERPHETKPHAANLSPEVADPICRLPLPTFFYSTRGCLPWRPAADMGTRREGGHRDATQHVGAPPFHGGWATHGYSHKEIGVLCGAAEESLRATRLHSSSAAILDLNKNRQLLPRAPPRSEALPCESPLCHYSPVCTSDSFLSGAGILARFSFARAGCM